MHTTTAPNRAVALRRLGWFSCLAVVIALSFVAARAQSTPVLSATPGGLVINAVLGGANPPASTIAVANAGSGTLTFTASSDSPWLSVTPTAGTAPQSVQVSASIAGLTLGTYTAHVMITSTGAQGSPATIPVALTIGEPSDWITGFHDAARSGQAFDESTISTSNVGSLQLVWSTTVDGSVVAQPLFLHAVTIAGQTRDVLVVATGGNSLYALDATSGAVLWTRNFGASTPNTYGLPDGFGIEAPPAIDRVAGRVYTVSTDGRFHALSLYDGTDLYTPLALVANPTTNKIWGALNLVGGKVYVATGSNGGDQAPWRGQVYQVDVSGAPALTADFVVVPSIPSPNGGGGIWGYGGVSADLATSDIYATSAWDSNQTTLPYSNAVLALGADLALLGYYQPSEPSNYGCDAAPCDLDFASTPVVFQPAGCPTMLAAGNKNGNLYVFRASDLAAGGQPWQILTLNAANDSIGSGAVAGVPAFSSATNMLYIGDTGPGVTGIPAGIVALSATGACTFQVAWSHALGGNDTPNSGVTIANGVAYISENTTGVIHAYDAQTGVQLWQSGSTPYQAAATFSPPIVAGGRVFAGSWSSLSGGGLVGAFALPAGIGPTLSVTPSTLSFTASVGGANPAPATLSVANTGGGTLTFTASSDSTWLTVSPTGGPAPATLQVSAASSSLAAGTYTGHVTVTSLGAAGSPATIPVTLSVGGTGATITVDAKAFGDGAAASSSITTSTFSTQAGNELLLAFVATDYLSGTNTTVTGVSGAGLTWQLVKRTNAQHGSAEIWRAFAPSALSNVTVTATLSQSVVSSLTVVSYAGVDTSGANGSGAIGATGSGSASSGAPTATLTTTRSNSLVVGVGNDWDQAIARTAGAGQVLIHQDLSPTGDTYWAQQVTAPIPVSGTTVTFNDTAPTTDRYNLTVAEVLPSLAPTWSISGTISGTGGETVTLSGAASATTTADGSGAYSFTGLLNGAYTVTPSKPGYSISPTSLPVTVNNAAVSGVNFTASPLPTYSISGTVSPAFGGGMTVTASGAGSGTATTDSSGNYTISGLGNGAYTVTPSASGYAFTPASQPATIAGAPATGVNFTAQAVSSIGIDVTTSTDRSTKSTSIATSAFSTTSANELLLAFVGADYLSGTNTTVKGVTGAGLTWQLVGRTNTQAGTAEIWRAFAPTTLSSVTVTATLSQSVAASLTVMSFRGVDTSGTYGSGAIGAIASGNANPGAPTATLKTTRNNSLVVGAGNDWDAATARTLGGGQTLVHQYLATVGDTSWVQRTSAPVALSGTSVTLNDTAPSADRYNLTICEILVSQ